MADRFSYSCRRNHSSSNLSFSSTLLEEIYESIDEAAESMRKKRDDATTRFLFETDEEMANYQRACMIERWMEKKAVARGRSIADLQEKMSGKDRQCSSSSSSDSSCGGGRFFSSSEAESFAVPPPNPVRTGKSEFEKEKKAKNRDGSGINRRGFSDGSDQKSKSESGFVKTKSKAQKIYGDLKKAKQPTSPGGKVAAFLNSIFATGNLKKTKTPAACGGDTPSLKSTTTTTCSSPFSRSCLSRMATPSSAKSAAATKRSVRFFPATDEDRRPCGRKSLLNDNSVDVDSIVAAIDEELAMHVRKKEHSFDIFNKIRDQNRGFDREFDDEVDGASCASSDLFELENLSAIGMEELPVYETTHLEKIMQMD